MNKLAKFAVTLAAGVGAIGAFSSTVSAHHTNVSGVASCLAADGTYSVEWTVTYPNEEWAQGQTAQITSEIALTPGTLTPGASASGTGTGYTGASATIVVTGSWSGGYVNVDSGTVVKPTEPCTPIDVCTNLEGTQTSVPAGMTIVNGVCEMPKDVCANLPGSQDSAPSGYVVSGSDCVLVPVPTDVCANIGGVQTSAPSGYIVSGTDCVEPAAEAAPPAPTTTVPAVAPKATAAATAELPVTGSSPMLAAIAAAITLAGAAMLVWGRRSGATRTS